MNILIGICSAHSNPHRREAVRATWLSKPQPGIEGRFFIGEGPLLEDEPDTVVLAAEDSYEGLPGKVLAFFAHALATSDFDWLFKCDDDTYLALERLPDLIDEEHDLVGNEFVETRGSPSGGAGYLLSRALVEKLVADQSLPGRGIEDVLIGEAAIRLGAKAKGTERLCWTGARFPMADNEMISSHWCSPERLRTIHAFLNEPFEEVHVLHPFWKDKLILSSCGSFARRSSSCQGTWLRREDGSILLNWEGWAPEVLTPVEGEEADANGLPVYLCTAEPSAAEPAASPAFIPAPGTPEASKILAVFFALPGRGLPHLDAFLQYNPEVAIHVVNLPALDPYARSQAWRNADAPIWDWWDAHGRYLPFEHAVFLEWDVLFAAPVQAIFPSGADFCCKDLKKPGAPWMWFAEVERLPLELQEHATGVAPLAILRMSRTCLSELYDHPLRKEVYDADIFCELRLPTLATACGYEPVEYPGTLSTVDWCSVEPGEGSGVWHAVKARRPDGGVPQSRMADLALA